MNEYVATFEKCEQVSPDDWRLFTQALKITDETTIGQIRKWMSDTHRASQVTHFQVILLGTLKDIPNP